MALMENLFLQLVLIKPVFSEQVLWQEPNSETQPESQYSRFDFQISKPVKKKKKEKFFAVSVCKAGNTHCYRMCLLKIKFLERITGVHERGIH